MLSADELLIQKQHIQIQDLKAKLKEVLSERCDYKMKEADEECKAK